MVRWSQEETEALKKLRSLLIELSPGIISSGTSSKSLQNPSFPLTRPQYPDLVGDRKLLRFLRGHDYNIEKVADLYIKSMRWRTENKVDEIRERIIQGGCDHPTKFPHADKILHHMPHIVIAPNAFDNGGSPICLDQYGFSPSAILAEVTISEYIEFAIYSLEYRQLVLEQMSEEREREVLRKLSTEERESKDIIYGVIINTCVIRDIGSVGLEHFSGQGQGIIRSVISMASDNYPELMKKCFMINTPWVFNTIWYFIKGLLSVRTANKVTILGSDFRRELELNIPKEFIPVLAGGEYDGAVKYEPYPFDLEYFAEYSSVSV